MFDFNAKNNKVCCVVDSDKITNDLLDNFSREGLQYYAIYHDKDVNNDGVLKTPHWHIVLVRSTRCLLKWFFKRVKECLNIQSDVQIQMQTCGDLVASVQYLIHKNDSNKTQYLPFDIISNVDTNTINNYLTQDVSDYDMSFDYLEQICRETACNKLEIMKKIGIGKYNCYRATINEFIEQFKPIYLEEFERVGAYETLKKNMSRGNGQ